jgi:hypothetical protein
MIYLITLIVGYIFILSIGTYTLFNIYKHPADFGARITTILNFFTVLNAIFIYSTSFLLSIIFFFSKDMNLIIWKLSLISGFIGLLLLSLIYSFLIEYKKIPYFPFLYFIILFGLLIGFLYSPDSINIVLNSPVVLVTEPDQLTYIFDPFVGFFIILYQSSFFIYFFTLSYMMYKNARKKKRVIGLIINTCLFFLPMLVYIFYIIFQIPHFKEIHILLLWLNLFIMCYILIRKPEMVFEQTNKIFYINIYHKSGILLYSYKFGNDTNEIDSTIWGNILIGINHILSEFVDPKDQIEVLQTDNSDIIVNYDEIGFAVVLITNRKNDILKKLMNNFAKDFKNKYKKELTEIQDLNKLINVSEFKETKEIIERSFQIYLN